MCADYPSYIKHNLVEYSHCVVCSSSIYWFWLPRWYLQTLPTTHVNEKEWDKFIQAIRHIQMYYLPPFCNSIKTFNFPTLYTTIRHWKPKDRLKEFGQLCFIKKKNGQRRYKCQEILFCTHKKSFLILLISSLKLISSNCLSFRLTTHLLCLVDVFFNRESAYLWVQTVLFALTCFVIRRRITSYRGFSRKTERIYPDPLISRSSI
jgi:hypothetical protein